MNRPSSLMLIASYLPAITAAGENTNSPKNATHANTWKIWWFGKRYLLPFLLFVTVPTDTRSIPRPRGKCDHPHVFTSAMPRRYGERFSPVLKGSANEAAVLPSNRVKGRPMVVIPLG